jgi:hypothetical protein
VGGSFVRCASKRPGRVRSVEEGGLRASSVEQGRREKEGRKGGNEEKARGAACGLPAVLEGSDRHTFDAENGCTQQVALCAVPPSFSRRPARERKQRITVVRLLLRSRQSRSELVCRRVGVLVRPGVRRRKRSLASKTNRRGRSGRSPFCFVRPLGRPTTTRAQDDCEY